MFRDHSISTYAKFGPKIDPPSPLVASRTQNRYSPSNAYVHFRKPTLQFINFLILVFNFSHCCLLRICMDNYYYHLLIDFSVRVTKYLSKFAQFLIFVKLYSKTHFALKFSLNMNSNISLMKYLSKVFI